jgi:uncharacterized protein (DUF952 family)
MSELIYHVTARRAWEAAQKSGKYEADSLAGQGFIHCSKVDQVLRVANNIFKGQPGLVLLVIDTGKLTSPLKWEPGEDLATEVFPHVYGPVNLEAIQNVLDFEPGPDGTFGLPEDLG